MEGRREGSEEGGRPIRPGREGRTKEKYNSQGSKKIMSRR